MPFSKLLVGVDLTEISDAVVNSAKQIAGTFGAKLYLTTIIEPPMPVLSVEPDTFVEAEELSILLELEKELQKEAKEKLEKYASNLSREGYIVETIVEVGNIVDTILDLIEEKEIDLLVIGSHKKGLIDKLLLGSVSKKLINESPVSTLIVKGKQIDKLEKLLVGYDFLPSSKQAILTAEEIAILTNGEIFIVHADTDIKFAHIKGIYKTIEEKKKQILQEIVSDLNSKGISAFFEILKEPAIEAILEEIEKYNPDLVILGKRKSSTLKRLFLGTTAQKIVENAFSPVLIVRRKNE
ncbi:MAG TPA: universal stress protein [Persephonella sp.]|nr:universal stress protein [Hydrogenothermaceae bacterium]HIQ25441.1 universal stress protein [Persephonella sp.]